jgi:hypothetical protein
VIAKTAIGGNEKIARLASWQSINLLSHFDHRLVAFNAESFFFLFFFVLFFDFRGRVFLGFFGRCGLFKINRNRAIRLEAILGRDDDGGLKEAQPGPQIHVIGQRHRITQGRDTRNFLAGLSAGRVIQGGDDGIARPIGMMFALFEDFKEQIACLPATRCPGTNTCTRCRGT